MNRLKGLSRLIHNMVYDDYDQSLCSRAHMKKEESLFWRLFHKIFGHDHCYDSYAHYHIKTKVDPEREKD